MRLALNPFCLLIRAKIQNRPALAASLRNLHISPKTPRSRIHQITVIAEHHSKMFAPFALFSLQTELQLEILGFLPCWDLYALLLTNHHLYDPIGPIQRPTCWNDDCCLPWTDDTIQAKEDSTWAKHVPVLFCNACSSIILKA